VLEKLLLKKIFALIISFYFNYTHIFF